MLLSALATHGTFIIERVARELSYPLKNASMLVSGSFDPRGVAGEAIDPGIQTVRARFLRSKASPMSKRRPSSLRIAAAARCMQRSPKRRASIPESSPIFGDLKLIHLSHHSLFIILSR